MTETEITYESDWQTGWMCGSDFRPNSMTRAQAETMRDLALEDRDQADVDFWNGYLLGIEHRSAA